MWLQTIVFSLLVSATAQAELASLIVSGSHHDDQRFEAELVQVGGEHNPLLCQVAKHRLDLIEELSKKIRRIHEKITPNIERWWHRRYLEEIRLLEQQLEFNFNYLNQRTMSFEARWDIRKLPEIWTDRIFMEEDVDSKLESPVLVLQTWGNLHYPEDLIHLDVEKAVDGVLPIRIQPSVQEYCSGPLDLHLRINIR